MFLERGDHTFVGTFDGRPYQAPFSGNVIDLCPVGALTNTAYRFRARPWDIEGAGTICTLCPSQCNVELTVRDERVERVLAARQRRRRRRLAVRQGPLGLPVRRAPTSRVLAAARARRRTPAARRRGSARSPRRPRDSRRPASAAAAVVGGQTTNEEGWLLQRIFREALGSPHVDARPGGPLAPSLARAARRTPTWRPRCPTSTAPPRCWCWRATRVDEAPIFDLRLRKAVRRFGTRLVVASSAPDRARRRRHARCCASRPAAPRRCCARSRRRCSRRERRRRTAPPTGDGDEAPQRRRPRRARRAARRALARAPGRDRRGRPAPTCATPPRC